MSKQYDKEFKENAVKYVQNHKDLCFINIHKTLE